MLKDIITNRYSARFWDSTEVEKSKMDYILDCAYSAPSKQGLYPYTIHALTNSTASKDFKEYLFWNDTWCVDGWRAGADDVDSNNKRFNGQYRAPLLLVWSHRIPNNSVKAGDTWKHYKDASWKVEQNIVDMTVSASFAMLAAEEQGLNTCFGRCHSNIFTDTILGNGDVSVVIVVGIGYATKDTRTDDIMVEEIRKNGTLQGYNTRNLTVDFPKHKHDHRRVKPTPTEIIKIL